MNTDLILKHTKHNNPYGLYNKFDEPFTRDETITLFNKLKMTDEELTQLNEYVLVKKGNTFYDNAFGLFYNSFSPMNYIEGLRCSKDMIEDYESHHNINYCCHTENEEWEAILDDIIEYECHLRLIIKGAGSQFETLIGETHDYTWICFPYINKATTLAHPTDIYWNLRELSLLLDSTKDGATITYAIKELYDRKLILKGDILRDDKL